MSITSLTFVIFAFGTILVYYLMPKRFQWVVLLAANVVFYWKAGLDAGVFVLITATSIYFSALFMDGILKKQKEQFVSGKATLT